MDDAGDMGAVREWSSRADRVRAGGGRAEAGGPGAAIPAAVVMGAQEDRLGLRRAERQSGPGGVRAAGPRATTTPGIILPLPLHPAPHLYPDHQVGLGKKWGFSPAPMGEKLLCPETRN